MPGRTVCLLIIAATLRADARLHMIQGCLINGNLKNHRLAFGGFEPDGIRVKFQRTEGRPSILTSLGWQVLDSGANHPVLFRGEPAAATGLLWMAAGPSQLGLSGPRSVAIEAQTAARTDAVIVPRQDGRQEDGLIPGSFFRSIYISNSKAM